MGNAPQGSRLGGDRPEDRQCSLEIGLKNQLGPPLTLVQESFSRQPGAMVEIPKTITTWGRLKICGPQPYGNAVYASSLEFREATLKEVQLHPNLQKSKATDLRGRRAQQFLAIAACMQEGSWVSSQAIQLSAAYGKFDTPELAIAEAAKCLSTSLDGENGLCSWQVARTSPTTFTSLVELRKPVAPRSSLLDSLAASSGAAAIASATSASLERGPGVEPPASSTSSSSPVVPAVLEPKRGAVGEVVWWGELRAARPDAVRPATASGEESEAAVEEQVQSWHTPPQSPSSSPPKPAALAPEPAEEELVDELPLVSAREPDAPAAQAAQAAQASQEAVTPLGQEVAQGLLKAETAQGGCVPPDEPAKRELNALAQEAPQAPQAKSPRIHVEPVRRELVSPTAPGPPRAKRQQSAEEQQRQGTSEASPPASAAASASGKGAPLEEVPAAARRPATAAATATATPPPQSRPSQEPSQPSQQPSRSSPPPAAQTQSSAAAAAAAAFAAASASPPVSPEARRKPTSRTAALALKAVEAAEEAHQRRQEQVQQKKEAEEAAARLKQEERFLIQSQDQEFQQSLLMDQLKELLSRQKALLTEKAELDAEYEDAENLRHRATQRMERFGENPRLAEEAARGAERVAVAQARRSEVEEEVAEVQEGIGHRSELLAAMLGDD